MLCRGLSSCITGRPRVRRTARGRAKLFSLPDLRPDPSCIQAPMKHRPGGSRAALEGPHRGVFRASGRIQQFRTVSSRFQLVSAGSSRFQQ
eukprot:4298827-Alexandrium_andersonii.AAC.1